MLDLSYCKAIRFGNLVAGGCEFGKDSPKTLLSFARFAPPESIPVVNPSFVATLGFGSHVLDAQLISWAFSARYKPEGRE